MSIKVLLFGANGNLGSMIKKYSFASKSEIELISWTREDGNVTQFDLVKEKLLQIKPNVVINTIAYNGVDACEDDEKEQENAKKLNIDFIRLLCEVCLEINAQLVTFSTNYVFSGKKEYYVESDLTDPINFYGYTKKMGEEIVTEYIQKGLTASILRVANLFGENEVGKSSKKNFFDAIIEASIKQKKLHVVDDEKCCFTYTKDVAKVIETFVNRPNDMKGIHHVINSGEANTWYQATKILFDKLDIHVDVEPINGLELARKAKRPRSAVLKVTNSNTPILRDFNQALDEYINYLQIKLNE